MCVLCTKVSHIAIYFYTFVECGFETLLKLTERKRIDPKREGNMTPAGLGHIMAVCGLVGVAG
jgi:hypothetical protein